MNLDEIGVINDIIQERVGNKADITMTVSENKNLGKSLSITIIMSEFDTSEKKLSNIGSDRKDKRIS
jgi:cell division GTPase FtsZ